MSDDIIPSDAGKFLLFQTEDGQTRIEVRLENETVWLSQKVMAELFQKDVRTINEYISNIFAGNELQPESVNRNFRITAADNKHLASPFNHDHFDDTRPINTLLPHYSVNFCDLLFDRTLNRRYISHSKPAGPLSKDTLTSAGLSFFAPEVWR